jgi:hypothetical protein
MRDFNVSIRELVETTRYADPATGEPCESGAAARSRRDR